MNEKIGRILSGKLDDANRRKLEAVVNAKLHEFIADAAELCTPDAVFVCSDAAEDIAFLRQLAIGNREETPLKIKGHTVHFDGPQDQGRDKEKTKYLVPPGVDLGANINSIDYDKGLKEVTGFLRGSMAGRLMLVRFFCLGPTGSPFSISGVQITDSAYVGHSEDLLYRAGYEQFRRLGDSPEFFRVLHSAGRLENQVSAEVDSKRIYIDLQNEIVYSVNTQYAGNTVGFKKLALRLAICKADREKWLAEHMFIMGAHGPAGRVTYFAGAFPSACGKTSTSMMAGHSIIGDDLAYLRVIDGEMRTVNVESGIFGIIQDCNAEDDPILWESLTTPGEVIFSNVLVADGAPYWLGDKREHPTRGVNYTGDWYDGKVDEDGNEIPCAHKNARYTIRLAGLRNLDPKADAPEGVPLGGIIYGGRDSDTWAPVQQSLDWAHGVITMGASLESETTAATIGKEGIRAFQPMSILDFLAIPLGRYLQNHLDFVKGVERQPIVFAVNYFQKAANGTYLTGMNDKNVWLRWMEMRVHGELHARVTPTGCIPRYEDLRRIFKEHLGIGYAPDQYHKQFRLRIPEHLAKLERIENIYRRQVKDAPHVFFDVLDAQRRRLNEARQQYGDYISPFSFEIDGED